MHPFCITMRCKEYGFYSVFLNGCCCLSSGGSLLGLNGRIVEDAITASVGKALKLRAPSVATTQETSHARTLHTMQGMVISVDSRDCRSCWRRTTVGGGV